jgi:tetratricopeptide (TPR) repeat protein
MGELLDGLVHGWSQATRAELAARAEGIPLFAVETVRALIDLDLVVPVEGRYVPAVSGDIDVAAIGAPASLQSLVAARLDALAPSERRLVADASVLGVSFTQDGLAVLTAGVPNRDAALASLLRKEILALQTDRFSAERGQYRFVQGIVRQVAYGTLSKRDRKARHLAVASHLSEQPDAGEGLSVVVAQHYLDAIDASSPGDADLPELVGRATELLERAAARAASLGSHAEALRLLEAALQRSDAAQDRARLYEKAAKAALDSGRYEHAMERASAATEAWGELGDAVASGRSSALQGSALLEGPADYAAVLEVLEPHWRALEGVDDAQSALLPLAAVLARAHDYRGEPDLARPYVERQIRLAEAVDEPAQLAEAIFRFGSLFNGTGAPTTAAMLYQNAADLAREHHLSRQLARALTNLATVQIARDVDAAVATGLEAIKAARATGTRNTIDYAAGNLAVALWTAGRWSELRELEAEVADLIISPQILLLQVALQWWIWQATGGITPPDRYDVPELHADHRNAHAWAAHLQLIAAQHRGDLPAAAAAGETSVAHALAWSGVEDDFMFIWPPAVLAAIDAHELDRADRLLSPVAEGPPGLVTPALSAHLAQLRGLIGVARGDDPDQVVQDLHHAIVAMATFGAVPHRARTEDALGRFLVAQGRAQEAEPWLAAARAAYDDLGAHAWQSNLDEWSRARGIGPFNDRDVLRPRAGSSPS